MNRLTLTALIASASVTVLSLGSVAQATPVADTAALSSPSLQLPGPTLDPLLFARRGADDAAGHVRRGRGKDDPVGHAARQLAPQEIQVIARRGRGKDDPVGHG